MGKVPEIHVGPGGFPPSGVVLYGASPVPDDSPRIPYPPLPIPIPLPDGRAAGAIPLKVFDLCPKCQQHVWAGTACPFCYADSVAKAPTRQAVEKAKASLAAAKEALAAARTAVAQAEAAVDEAQGLLDKAMEGK
jgi:hypothetical protein